MATPKKETKNITIVPPNLHSMIVRLKGITPLLTSNGQAAVPKLVEHMSGPKQKTPRAPRDAQADFEASRYRMADGRDGFPGTGIKRSLKDAAIRNGAGVGTQVMALVQIDVELVPILTDHDPICAEHYVRHGNTPDLAYRAQYTDWSLEVPVTYNAGAFAQEHVLSLFELAGFSIGIGAWRPEKNGTFGRFRLDGATEIA